MAYNPYQVAGSESNLLEALAESQSLTEKMRGSSDVHKGKLTKEFEEEMMEQERLAQEALQKRKSKKGGLGLLSTLAGFIPGAGPILSGLIGGVGSIVGSKRSAKHAESMARLAKQHALKIDPKWEKSFLGSAARKRKGEAEDLYGGILREAEDVSKEASSLGGMLKTGVTSGLTSFATGKAVGTLGEKLSGVADIKKLKGMLPEGIDANQLEALSKDKSFIKSLTGEAGFTPGDLTPQLEKLFTSLPEEALTQLQKVGAGGLDISKMLEAKSPFFQALFQGIGAGGKQFAQEGPFAEDSDMADILTSLLGMSESQRRLDL